MSKFRAYIEDSTQLKAMTGLSPSEFESLLALFTRAIPLVMAERRMDGGVRDGRRWANYTNSPLPSAADKLVFILTYLRQNPIQAIQGQLFQMSQSNVSKWVSITHDMLNRALLLDTALPCRTAHAFQDYVNNRANHGESAPLFIMTAPNARFSDQQTTGCSAHVSVVNHTSTPSKT